MIGDSRPNNGGNASAEWDASSLPVSQVQELFVILQKALRAFQLYDENNPVYQRFVSNLREAFGGLWGEVDELRVQIEEDRIRWHGCEVYSNASRSESLAFLFFKDGVRDIQFLPGLERLELERFLRVLQRARNLRPEGDDLLTILWDEDLEHFQYQYVDLLAEGVELPEKGNDPGNLHQVWVGELSGAEPAGPDGLSPSVLQSDGAATAEPPPAKINPDDFNPTLYSLDPRELDHLKAEVDAEMRRDLRRDVLFAIFDRLEEAGDAERHTHILDIVEMLLPNLLSRGALGSAAMILEELTSLPKFDDVLLPDQLIRADRILDRISGSEAIAELINALSDGSIDPGTGELSAFLVNLKGGALEILLAAAERTEDKRLQSTLLEAVTGIGERNREAVLTLLDSHDTVVVAGACRLSGRMGLGEAGPRLSRLLSSGSPEIRLAAIEAAVALRVSTAAAGLQEALGDADREIRIAAARGLGTLRYRPAAARFKELIMGRSLRQADLSEKIAFFESYGDLGDAEAVQIFGKLLNKKSLLGRREPEEIRACAALGLGRMGTPDALAHLEAAGDTSDPVVRSAVSRALKRSDA